MTTTPQADPLIGRLVDGRYRVRARIARGGMATVYVATDLRLERRIALKVMHGHLSDDSVFQSRFIQEARAAARLADPNVVNVFDQGQDGELAYLVMEYLPGITLRELLREQRRLSIPQTVTIMDAILSGLAAAHRADIVHRDVKPENVLLAEDGRIKIGDFGLARATSANTATGQQLMGTIAYLAPELVTRGTADARSDIYALGIMLYEMLTGEQPYKGEQPMQIAFQHATESVPRPSVRNPGVPEQLDELVLWSTEKSPDERPRSAQEMLDRLREIEKELGITPISTTTPALSRSRSDSQDLTQVLPGSTTAPTAIAAQTVPDEPDNATRLRRRSTARRRRGGALLIIVILLAALAAGAGWWFGSGPGSMNTVPDVSGQSFDEASAVLTQHEFVAAEAGANSLDVPAGQVISTDPASGDKAAKGETVTVVISQGPASHDVGRINELTQDEATAMLRDLQVEVSGTTSMYSGAEAGLVINAYVTPRAGGDAYECGEGCSLFEGDTVELLVSLGGLPDVVGMTVDEATSALADKLTISGTETEYSDDVEKGRIIRTSEPPNGGNWRQGDAISLVVSDGPEPVEVPDVTGMTRGEAAEALEEAGFVANIPDSVWDWPFAVVSSQTPAAGTMHPRGSEVVLRFRAVIDL